MKQFFNVKSEDKFAETDACEIHEWIVAISQSRYWQIDRQTATDLPACSPLPPLDHLS